MPKFETILTGSPDGPTGIIVPPKIIEELGKGKRPGVQVTVNEYTFLSTVGVMGSTFMIPFSSEHRKNSGISAGDPIEVSLTAEDKPREVELPLPLAEALERQSLRAKFDSLAPSKRKEYVRHVSDAKSEDTRNRRMEKILRDLT